MSGLVGYENPQSKFAVFNHRNAAVNLNGNAPCYFFLRTTMTESKQIDQQKLDKVIRREFLSRESPPPVEIRGRFVGRLKG